VTPTFRQNEGGGTVEREGVIKKKNFGSFCLFVGFGKADAPRVFFRKRHLPWSKGGKAKFLFESGSSGGRKSDKGGGGGHYGKKRGKNNVLKKMEGKEKTSAQKTMETQMDRSVQGGKDRKEKFEEGKSSGILEHCCDAIHCPAFPWRREKPENK